DFEASRHSESPTSRVLATLTVPFGASAGLLQAIAVSPSRAAGLWLMSTRLAAVRAVARFDAAFWNVPPVGTCRGRVRRRGPTGEVAFSRRTAGRPGVAEKVRQALANWEARILSSIV